MSAPAAVAMITADQAEVLASVFADAIHHREPPFDCSDCKVHPADLCDVHASDMDLTDVYLALATELGIEVDL
jgi:hypothetical protein